MRVPKAKLVVGTYVYENDGPQFRPGVPVYKKGDTYCKSNSEWVDWIQYMCQFCGSTLNIIDVPKKFTDEQKKDFKDTVSFICEFSDYLNEDFLIKVINKARSKKILILPYLIEEFKKTEEYKEAVKHFLRIF